MTKALNKCLDLCDSLLQAKFNVGTARCDNRLAKILNDFGHKPINPSFIIHAIEIHRDVRLKRQYDTKNSVFMGEGMNVPLLPVSSFQWSNVD